MGFWAAFSALADGGEKFGLKREFFIELFF
jgi:hypothetical protein